MVSSRTWQRNTGFTLIEILLAFAIISALALMGIGAYQLLFQRSLVDQAAAELMLTLQEAQDYSVRVKEGKAYGVHLVLDISEYLLITDNKPVDIIQVYRLPASVYFDEVTFAGDEVFFAKLTGTSSVVGSITLSDGRLHKRISVSGNGVIDLD
ncbi:type II secretion system GspH family protein [Patescibacteria group bacterium]|nr:type II secretion system GspH family protein [Patescibacteria group bacterium]MBU1867961.1 type II secretion system GspH family protein [Patescibacteria group bacterium]